MKDLIKYSKKWGFYVSSYDLAKATGKKHQNLMTIVKRKYKNYIPHLIQDHQYYKNQKIFLLVPHVIRAINKNGIYDEILEEMEQRQQKKFEEIKEKMKQFFSKWE